MRSIYRNIFVPDRPDPGNIMRIDMAVLPILSAMEANGMKVDIGVLEDLEKVLIQEMGGLEAKAEGLTGYRINIGSGDQLADVLFSKDKLHLKQPGKEKWTRSKARLSVDADVLKGMVSQHPVIDVYLEWKVREKLRSTYTHTLVSQLDPSSRAHPDIIHTGQETGRITCKDPNLTTIPTRTKLGQEIRKAFIPEKGNVIGTCDLSQIEMRHAAEDAKCQNLMDVFIHGKDLYWSVAEGVFQRTYSKEDRDGGINPDSGLTWKEDHRQSAKVIALGTIYDISAEGLLDQLLVYKAISFLTGGESKVWDYDKYYKPGVERCRTAISNFFVPYRELLDRRKVHHKRAMKYGLVWEMFGRHRWIPQVYSTHKWIINEGLRAAGNHPIQGACSSILKLWLIILWDRIQDVWGHYGIKPLMAVHDEILVEGPKSAVEGFLEEAGMIVRELMPRSVYTTPLKASYDLAGSWGEIKK